MTDEEYQLTQNHLGLAVAMIRGLDLRGFLERLACAEALGPILDPTLYRVAASKVASVRRIAEAAMRFKAVIDEEVDEEVEDRRVPDGTPGVRDVDAPCELFRLGTPTGTGRCLGDGHYLCHECEGWTPEVNDDDG